MTLFLLGDRGKKAAGCRGEKSFAPTAAKERGALNDEALPGEKFFARQRLPPIEVSAFEPKPL
jgi:hypothetical protein